MAIYRYQSVCVGMWRGRIKRWNTTWYSSSTSKAGQLKNILQAICYPNPGDTTGDCSGGVAAINVYNSTGGAPREVNTYFDWQAPSTWIPYTGTAWSSIPETTPIDASGESAMVIVGHLPGLSASGKPMSTRKYIHAIPSRTAADYSDPDIPDGIATAIAATTNLSTLMVSPGGVSPSSVEVPGYYQNHQRVRGRRRTTRQVAGQAFSLGVLAGGGATTSGQGDQFPGGEF